MPTDAHATSPYTHAVPSGADGGARFDDVDLAVAMAVVAEVCGLAEGVPMAEVAGPQEGRAGLSWYHFEPEAVAALAQAGSEGCAEYAWVELAEFPLGVELTSLVGGEWRAEVDVTVSSALAERACLLPQMAEMARRGPVAFDTTATAAEVLAQGFPDPTLLLLV